MTPENNTFAAEYARLRALTDARLEAIFTERTPAPSLTDAMRYGTVGGGKRVRAVMVLAFCALCGGEEARALDAACGVELLHAYTLIHDDLPCMDDDDTRRGKPSCHIAFGQWRAVLAGDALQAEAFGRILGCDLPPRRVAAMGRILARAAGAQGVCAGQTLDMEAETAPPDADGLRRIHLLKTAVLFEAAAQLGVTAAGGDAAAMDAAGEYARAVGLAFQLRDDLLDLEDGTDAEKVTFASVFGAARCEEMVRAETARAVSALERLPGDGAFLRGLAETLAGRRA